MRRDRQPTPNTTARSARSGSASWFGLTIIVIYATGRLSGAHINASVTIAFTPTRHFSPRDAIAYISAQLTGATLAALALLGVWPSK